MMNDWNDKLEALMLEKEFDDLDTSQMTAVLAVMTAGEYAALRQALLHARAMATTLVGFPRENEVLMNLKSAMAKERAWYKLTRIPRLSITAWKAAVFTLLCCAATGWSVYHFRQPQLTPTKVTDVVKQEIYIHDTIYINKNIYIKSPDNKPFNYNYAMTSSNPATPAIVATTTVDSTQLQLTDKVQAGISLDATAELNVFFTGIQ